MATMKAVVFRGQDRIAIEEVPKPVPKAGEAVIRITATTICGTDVHIVRGEYPVAPGLTLGHEPVGVIEELGAGLEKEYAVGQRVIVGAITPCGQCFYCLNGAHSQCGGALGGWRFGNTINGAWAEYLLVPDARANLAVIPDKLSDEDVLLCPDIFSTGLSGAESAHIRVGDSVAVFAQGPIGLCATLGAKLKGASLIIGIDSLPGRLLMSRKFGADVSQGRGSGPRYQTPDRGTRRRRRDRGARPAGDVRGRAARDSARRNALEPRRLLREARRAVRGDLRGARRPADRDDAVSGRQGADAPPHGDDRA
jgi:threonine dehydrogenase-like Zn-dependent dehydrogenase